MSRIDIESIYYKYIDKYVNEIKILDKKPKVVIIQVGDVPESNTYVSNKIKAFKEVGIEYEFFKFSNDITQSKLQTVLDGLSHDDNYTGIFVQLPLPKQLDFSKLKNYINPLKDIDGLCDENTIKLYNGDNTGILPATPAAVMLLLDELNIDLTDKLVCVINRSDLIGKPLIHLLTQKNATIIWCNSHTNSIDICESLNNSDIIVSGINKANIYNKQYFNNDTFFTQTIIDLTTVYNDGKLYGSIKRDDYKDIMKYNDLTTVGCGKMGMGKLTIIALIGNIIKSYKLQKFS